MTLDFTRADWDRLATLFDGQIDPSGNGRRNALGEVVDPYWVPYSGYKPEAVEAPNGDMRACLDCDNGPGYPHTDCHACHGSGRVPNVDAGGTCGCCGGAGHCEACHGSGRVQGKRYLHVADKYPDAPDWARAYHDRAYAHACRVATALGVPAAYYPRPEFGALRVLEYPAGAGSAEHTDFDLFTVLCWRETPEDLKRVAIACDDDRLRVRRQAAEALSPGLHIGELGELVGLGPATPHRVPARPYAQRSIVYFAIPDHGALLPLSAGTKKVPGYEGRIPEMRSNITVGEWLSERMARSRYEASR